MFIEQVTLENWKIGNINMLIRKLVKLTEKCKVITSTC